MYRQQVKWLLILPAFASLFLFTIYPLIFSVAASLGRVERLGGGSVRGPWFANYARLFSDGFFANALLNTGVFVVVSVLAEVALAVVLAVLFQRLDTRGTLQPLVLIPSVLPPLAISVAWKMIFDTNFGVLNWMLSEVGVEPIGWLDDQRYAMISLILVDIWQWTPFCLVLTVAGLQSIPTAVYEMAAVDGASGWAVLRAITLPLLKRYLVAVLVLRAIDAVRLFDQVFALTSGGPAGATETVSFYIYKTSLRFFEIGYGAAMSVVILVVSAIVAIVGARLLGGAAMES